MASGSKKRQSLFETIVDSFVPIHRDGLKFFMLALVVTALLFLLWAPLGWLGALVSAYIAYFFRDPDRVTPLRDGLVVAPADGRFSAIDKVKPPPEFGLGQEERVRVSIFLSVFDVHVQRAPVAGMVRKSIYVPGAFFNAALDKASEENERRALVIETPYGASIAVVQIAGLIARRILTFVEEGQSVGMGQRYGLIRFGSRLDIYLPPGKHPLIAIGQRAVAGETVISDLNSSEPERESVLS